MCLGTPSQIVELYADLPELAIVSCNGVHRQVNMGLLDAADLAVGDWVLVHIGFAVMRMEPAEAEASLAYLTEIAQSADDERVVARWGP